MPQTKTISIIPGQIPTPNLNVSQNDVGREVIFNIKDVEGWFDLTGCTAVLAGIKPSGLGFTVSGTISGHQITFVTTKQMTDEYGSIAAEVKISSGNNIIGSENIVLVVERDPHPENTTDGSIDEIIPEITILVERIEAAVEKAEVLQESEAWAVGTRDGVPVDEEDDTYHNNSKYYSEQAELSEAAARLYKTDAYNSKESASNSATEANNKKVAAETAKAAAEAAQTAAEIAARNAQSVFAVVGNMTAAVDHDTKKVTLYFTESEQQEG